MFMKSINTKFLTLLFVLIFSMPGFSVLAEDVVVDLTSTEVNTEQSPLEQSKTILAKIHAYSQQSADLKEIASEIPAFDRLLFITLIINVEKEIRTELDRLVNIQQQLDKNSADYQLLLQEIKPLTIAQEDTLKSEITVLKDLIGELQTQDSPDRSTDLTIQRAKQTIFSLLAAWQNNIEIQKQFNMDVTASLDRLRQIVQFIAIAQTGRIQISLDTISELDAMMSDADADTQKEINKQLNRLEWEKATAAENLGLMMDIMKQLGMNTTKFGQVLVVATGEILQANVEARAVIGLFKRLMSRSMAWLQENLPLIIFRLFSFLFIIFVFRIIAAVVRGIIDKATASSKFDTSQLLKDFLSSMAHKTVMIVGFIVALSQLGIEIGPLLAGMGIMGFVVGFALQDTLSNFASGLMILVYRPFDIDNFVNVAGGISGEVKQMNLVSTTILTIDNQRLIIPNSKIWGDIITNVTAERVRRIDFVFGIGYGDSISEAERVLRDIVDTHELILKKPETLIKIHTLNESSVDFIVRPWVKTQNYWDVYWDITRLVKERFDAEGISIPFPQRDVHIIQEGNSG